MNHFNFIETIKSKEKSYALLIDPDKYDKAALLDMLKVVDKAHGPDFVFVGGSLLFSDISETITLIKDHCKKPVIIFPGNQIHVTNVADGILFLSLISGRNSEFLIGNHVLAAPKLKKATLDIVPTGYILINCGNDTSVSYMSNTTPIPYDKDDIALATALAGEMLGLKCVYLEGGSGALKPVSIKMIRKIKSNLSIPVIVGGGIKTGKQFSEAFKAGADVVVIGNAIEQNPDLLNEFVEIKKNL